MPPRRHPSSSSVSVGNVLTQSPKRTSSPATQANRLLGMSPAVYQNNMKVLLRREPSIISILDQFSHVCLYHHNGSKWEKQGYEGSMFLFEKSTYPAYGFFILNRMGTDDYILPIYPEDDMEIVGDYVMFRFYPDFTKKRIEMRLPYPIPEARREEFDRELIRVIDDADSSDAAKEKKGKSVTLGLWMFATDAREPLKDVMIRLHSYIKQGLPYPEEFRYGPGHPPPPNPHLRTASRSSITQDSDSKPIPTNGNNDGPNELDKLFAKLITPSSSSSAAPTVTGSTSGMSVEALFNALNGSESVQGEGPPPSATSNRGLALLGSIFASASPATASPTANGAVHSRLPTGSLPPRPEDITIVSPKPTSNALPQILNQDVISTLLGLGPDSRASSAAPSSAGSRNRYEGDNEFSEGDLVSEGEYSVSSTVLDADADASAGSSSGIPLLAVHQSPDLNRGNRQAARRVEGDVTPRAGAGGIVLPPTSPPHSQHLTPASIMSPAPRSNGRDSAPVRGRPLVPFETNSDLWPYPRAPIDERPLDADSLDDADVVELDFSDTRALSDPAMFSNRLKEKRSRAGKHKSRKERERDRELEKEEIERGWDVPARVPAQQQVYQPGPSSAPAAAPSRQATVNGTKTTPAVNGDGHLNGVAAKEAVIASVSARPEPPHKGIARNDFVRELLTLIHTDKQFVDGLWQEYLARAT
ncbi:hypothetical protein A0H81_02320 [Grifola frondosa]|uniref:mRNA-decapping enzyme 1B n=1 Tax=Grifola frondosa TaxID=5627 RepID=A0A1C7MNP9_GRIFR|nr:hypothetical protein A0H81_02320 [Grifola frondosa]